MERLPRASPNLTGHVSVAKRENASSLWISSNACTEIGLWRCAASQWDCVEVNNLHFIPGYKQAGYYENEATWFLKNICAFKTFKGMYVYVWERANTHKYKIKCIGFTLNNFNCRNKTDVWHQ